MSKILKGKVVSTKMDKTIVVNVERTVQHPIYKKIVKKIKRYKVHCEDPTVKEGDIVEIQETRPLSKEKRFIVARSLEVKKKK